MAVTHTVSQPRVGYIRNTIEFPANLYEALEHVAATRGTSKKQVVLEALRRFLDDALAGREE